MLSFKHARRNRDEMKTWVTPGESGGIPEAARNPVYRTWEDYNGVLWLIGVEYASLREDSSTWITFRNAVVELSAPMPPDSALGELASEELVELLKAAV